MASNNSISKLGLQYLFLVLITSFAVGKSNEASDSECKSRCNLSQGYCTPNDECRCYPGWTGENCDECVVKTGCQQGTCSQPWECKCKEGWTGENCEIDTHFCENNQPCHNGGTCLSEEGTFICICPPEYTGKTCEVTTSTPAAVPSRRKLRECLNGGTCTYRSKHLGCQRCECPEGFSGSKCQTKNVVVKHCDLRPCANGGECIDLPNDFKCQCARGFSGQYCMTDINECELLGPSVCANHGRCINRVGSFKCVCDEGYRGQRCERREPVLVPSSTLTPPSASQKVILIYDQFHQETAPSKDTLSYIQAATFAFMGVALALFIGIALFLWAQCGGRNSCSCPSIYCVHDDSQNHPNTNRDKRVSAIVLDEDNDTYRQLSKPMLDGTTSTILELPQKQTGKSSRRPQSTLFESRYPRSSTSAPLSDNNSKSIDCLYVALPHQEQDPSCTCDLPSDSRPFLESVDPSPEYYPRVC